MTAANTNTNMDKAASVFDTMSALIASEIRSSAKTHTITAERFHTLWSTTGEGEITESSSGRARCRRCEEKIAKGDRALKVFMDQGGGTWTAVWWQIHAEDC